MLVEGHYEILAEKKKNETLTLQKIRWKEIVKKKKKLKWWQHSLLSFLYQIHSVTDSTEKTSYISSLSESGL